MTLTAFVNMIFTTDGICPVVYVFCSHDSRDGYRQDGDEIALEFSFKSPKVCKAFLNEKYTNTKVEAFYPVVENVVDVIIREG